MVGDPATFGILTVSDRANSGEYEDEGGPAILGFLNEAVASDWSHHYRIVPDESAIISEALIEMVDELGCDVVVTTGGTGDLVDWAGTDDEGIARSQGTTGGDTATPPGLGVYQSLIHI